MELLWKLTEIWLCFKSLGTVNVLKFQTHYSMFFDQNFTFIKLFLKILSGMANSVDQTASVGSESIAIFSEILVYEILRHLLYINLRNQPVMHV